MMNWAWIIPVLPLLSFLICLIWSNNRRVAVISTSLVALTFLSSVIILFLQIKNGSFTTNVEWVNIRSMELYVGFEINPLNALMLLIVSLVSFCVHLYSIHYMAQTARYPIYFGYVSFFTFAMLGLVMTTNLLQFYLFWELVGVGSFLLIGFYFHKKEAIEAARKAFLVTRIGDLFLFVGMILLFWEVGSLQFEEIFLAVQNNEISESSLIGITVLMFGGAVGKSAQFPLHIWLPDAMEGPTPVSALIHAATMVAAGVYLVAALYPLFAQSESTLLIISIVGAITALFAALQATVQDDIKRILAYSTISQLGYMMLALGSFGYFAGIFHLMTHAFFKALLFLVAGCIICALHTQRINEISGLWRKMPIISLFLLVGTLSISGFPFFAGFYSKEEILYALWERGSLLLFFIAILTTFLTSFYMFRLFFRIVLPKKELSDETIQFPLTVVIPLAILAVLSFGGGFVYKPLHDWIMAEITLPSINHEGIWIMIISIIMTLVGAGLAYVNDQKKRSYFALPLLKNGLYIDEFYQHTFVLGTKKLSDLLTFIERYVVGGMTKWMVQMPLFLGRVGGTIHNGQVQRYISFSFIGLSIILMVSFLIRGWM
ncbi:NADH-quinone oxidoreductase subunit L [Bacillus carboniphilus]|uniref:NADH-quinone oxidoreductase subunit L n=2 Tax=Bacillus carboniphilus TaxID=86663 RepID=A0ABY9K0V7_9BACI|nr:NADH-quinone oxidoreductase subunit L [Bacillus carboniphilus]WLR44325.1 NADH-quinone oxidoreductase subunit L [Bacillus carboniphilus]